VRGSAPSAQGWADPAPGVCMLGPRPTLAAGQTPRGRPQRPGLAALAPSVDSLS